MVKKLAILWFGLLILIGLMVRMDDNGQTSAEMRSESLKVAPISGVTQSDDYDKFGEEFESAARELIRRRRCAASDFREMGGFVRSVNRGPRTYFTYCGGSHISNRIYVKVSVAGGYTIE